MSLKKHEHMYVIKRNGDKENVRFDKITNRIEKLLYDIDDIDATLITQKICNRIFPGITTTELDNLASQVCMSMVTENSNFGILGSRIVISNHQKNTKESFLEVIKELLNNKDIHGNSSQLVSDELVQIVEKYQDFIQGMINFERDYLLDFFGFKTLEKSYLLKMNKKCIERPQHLFMRVAIGIHGNDLENVKKTYDGISLKYYTHATPTLFNAGCPFPQMSSCYLTATEDSIEGIFETITDCSKISKWAGGIGIHISNIRADGSYIRKTGGYSNGLMPMLKVYNDVARYINQGGKRNGSFSLYLEPWHSDIFAFLDAKKNHGPDELRARDLFYALWIPDIFMERVENDGDWFLMCPDKCPRLTDVYGMEFNTLYEKYVNDNRYNKKIKARELWDAIISSQIETGTPYMLYKDACNKKSNQKNIGTIKSSNLCSEIIEVSNKEETAVCNLASICLPSFLQFPNRNNLDQFIPWYNLLSKEELNIGKIYFKGQLKLFTKEDCVYCSLLKNLFKNSDIDYEQISEEDINIYRENAINLSSKQEDVYETVPQLFSCFDDKIYYLGGYDDVWKLLSPKINYEKLKDISGDIVVNLNKIIDKNFYPIEKTRVSNLRHRPIGIGVQGLADLFIQLRIPFDSPEAREINKNIFETIYYGAMESSCNLAKIEGSYSSFKGSPLSEGKFQFDLWELKDEELSNMWDWNNLRNDVVKNGVRNSLLTALMPTASTSQIMGFNEGMEAITSNLYVRRTLAGEFVVVNKYLMKDLLELDLWNEDTKNRLIYDKGSVQNIKGLPKFMKNIYRTVWEIPQKSIIEMSAARSPFICQSQSLNLFFEKPEYKKLTMAHLLGWKLGLKTGSYYIRSKPAVSAQSFGLDASKEKELKEEKIKEEEEGCLNCGA
jgi:ribonucleoside-diphosphate reductase alpha subunit